MIQKQPLPLEIHSVDSFLPFSLGGLTHGCGQLLNLLMTYTGFFLWSDIITWEVKLIINGEFSHCINLFGISDNFQK
jgi:hypothetical protein